LGNIEGLDTRQNEPLSSRTSFRIGGCAELFAVPRTLRAVECLVERAGSAQIPLTVLGGGTNVLISDDGIAGVVVDMRPGFAFLRERPLAGDTASWLLGAGCATGRFVRLAVAQGLAGAEVLAGIPGTIGGALMMNAGGRRGTIADVVRRVQVVGPTGTAWVSAIEAGFGYRQSGFSRQSILVAAELELHKADDPAALSQLTRDEMRHRRESQPLQLPNAGSIFKNPPGDFAGRLIEACGCKTLCEGDAQVSALHANFIVNTGRATAAQVARLIYRVRTQVLAQTSVQLLLEIRMLGPFDAELMP